MAFEYFASVGIDLAVLEVGMGGRLDATNVVDPWVSRSSPTSRSIIRSIWATPLPRSRARRQASFIANGLVVTLPQHPQANDVIGYTVLMLMRAVSAVQYVPPGSPGARFYYADTPRPSPAAIAIRSP